MKTTLYCLVIALIMRGAFDYVTAQIPTPTFTRYYEFASDELRISDSVKTVELSLPWENDHNWLRMHCQGDQKWHPSFTDIIVDYKPIVKILPNGRYEITFTSEIAENLP